MAGQSIAAASSQAWASMGSQAETALNSGWILDQTISSTGGLLTAAAPSTATAFLSSGDGTSGSGNGFWALGRPARVVHTGGTAYAQVTAASFAAPVTTVTLGLYRPGGTTSLSTVAVTSAAAGPLYSGQTGNSLPTWTLLAETVLRTSAANVDFTNISSGYQHLKLIARTGLVGSSSGTVGLQFNGDTGTNYYIVYLFVRSAAGVSFADYTGLARANVIHMFSTGSTAVSMCEVTLPYYAETTMYKAIYGNAVRQRSTAADEMAGETVWGSWRSAAGINRVNFVLAATSVGFSSGSVFSVYGIGGLL